MKDFYYILGTPVNCSPAEIAAAYHKLSGKLAPASDDDDYFLRTHYDDIIEAYQTLSDPAKRRAYDSALKKNQRKQIAHFKTGDFNIAATGLLIALTGIFGYYVFRSLTGNSHQTVAVVKPAPVVAAIPHKARHHKKIHHTHSQQLAKQPALTYPQVNSRVGVKPVDVLKDTVRQMPVVKKAEVMAASVVKPVVMAPKVFKADSTYTTYVKSNVAGPLYMHQTADYMSDVVMVVPRSSGIRVLQKGDTFYKIALGNEVGYLPKWAIEIP